MTSMLIGAIGMSDCGDMAPWPGKRAVYITWNTLVATLFSLSIASSTKSLEKGIGLNF